MIAFVVAHWQGIVIAWSLLVIVILAFVHAANSQ
jgi:hypothetical protein